MIEQSGMKVDRSGFRSEWRRRTVRTNESERGRGEEQRHGQQLEGGDARSRSGIFIFNFRLFYFCLIFKTREITACLHTDGDEPIERNG